MRGYEPNLSVQLGKGKGKELDEFCMIGLVRQIVNALIGVSAVR